MLCESRYVPFASTNVPFNPLQEWYGWHFPEMAKIISDNVAYAKTIRLMGMLFFHSFNNRN